MRPFLVALALVTTGASTLAAQQPAASPRPTCCAADSTPKPCPMMQGMQHDGGGMGMQHQGGGMGMSHGAGGHDMHAMMMRMDSVGQRLDSLTQVMQRATGQRKVDAIAAVVATMVAEQRAMQRHMHDMMMQQEMGQGGMGMGMGMMNGGSMDCGMMKSAGPGQPAGPPAAEPPQPHNH